MTQGAGLGNLLIFALPVLLIIFMFMTQRRRQREARAIQSSLSIGDDVCTTSGLFGRITALDEVMATLEIARGTVSGSTGAPSRRRSTPAAAPPPVSPPRRRPTHPAPTPRSSPWP